YRALMILTFCTHDLWALANFSAKFFKNFSDEFYLRDLFF
uniref:Uncharacterized protein n=1 Tax=Aegilops tauschii subsp. strangulata TaxID=200361 RepID=A0A453ILL5_AEGTS